ncbi:hypothetical protein B4135_1810 [Caldibacillus debilis]|uniref:Uncharacterized protein n=1 Tax=Caldibacillus debilis TaxID=301148 RepID=A0A150M915_9BACI|nr:hypothetical protein B4135_1810 [Caldibacillus debilis]
MPPNQLPERAGRKRRRIFYFPVGGINIRWGNLCIGCRRFCLRFRQGRSALRFRRGGAPAFTCIPGESYNCGDGKKERRGKAVNGGFPAEGGCRTGCPMDIGILPAKRGKCPETAGSRLFGRIAQGGSGDE